MFGAIYRRWASVSVVGVTALLVACGGSDPASSSASFSTDFERTSFTYRERTDALKAQARQSLGKGTEQLLVVYESMLGAAGDAQKEFDALRPPKALATEVDRLVDNLDQQERTLTDLVSTVKAGKTQDLTASLQELATLLVEFGKVHQSIQQKLE